MDSVNATSQAYIDSTMIHETGHLLSQSLWKDSNDEHAWKNAISTDGRTPSIYARDSPKEDFSESLVMYVLTKGTPNESATKILFPKRYELLDKILNNRH
jgi:type VI secretion system secreted protein VgrG